MEIIKVIILAIVEGITEFLPVSSTGHLILFHEFFKLEPKSFQNIFDVCIQLGPILAVVVLYFHKLYPFSKVDEFGRPARKDKVKYTLELWLKVIVGVIPSAVLGFLFDDMIDAHLFNPTTVSVTLVIWGILIILIENQNKKKRTNKAPITIEEMSLATAFKIGLFQCFALIPGTSRSAATILGGLMLGTSRASAAEFSFYLAIPTMFGATLLKVLKNSGVFTLYQWFLVFLGGLIGFIVAIIVIKKFMAYIKKRDFKVFGVYRIILGILVLLYSMIFGFEV